MMVDDNALPPDLARLLEQARSGAPEPTSILRDRVRTRVDATVTGSPGEPSSGEGGSTGSGAGASTLTGAVVKGLALLVVLGGIFVALRGTDSASEEMAVPAIASDPEPAAPSAHPELAPAPSPPKSMPEDEPIEPPPPTDTRPARASRRRSPSPIEPATAPDTLALEEALLEKARARLAADPQAALQELQLHATDFPRGQLAEERELLRARAHVAAGDNVAARDLAKRFLQTYPHSVNRREMTKIGQANPK